MVAEKASIVDGGRQNNMNTPEALKRIGLNWIWKHPSLGPKDCWVNWLFYS
jgi:hypothetical protein